MSGVDLRIAGPGSLWALNRIADRLYFIRAWPPSVYCFFFANRIVPEEAIALFKNPRQLHITSVALGQWEVVSLDITNGELLQPSPYAFKTHKTSADTPAKGLIFCNYRVYSGTDFQ